jgi:multidrug resistance efflux pump
MRYTEQSTKGSTTSDVANAQAKLQSMKSQLTQAQATLQRTESDSRRTIELAKQAVASDRSACRPRPIWPRLKPMFSP